MAEKTKPGAAVPRHRQPDEEELWDRMQASRASRGCGESAHQWAVTDWLEFVDTDHSYKEMTSFRPMVSTVARSKAIEATCMLCGETKRLT